jgi:protein tyrosine phosphatase (PTP) superfamily phosphohydrolase (DUF442 family)
MDKIKNILNYRKNSEMLSTSGQPTESEIKLLKNSGFEAVINIRPDFEMHYEFDEKSEVEKLGLEYFSLPMTFDTLDTSILSMFFKLVEDQKEKKTLIHCHHNIRVSVLLALYRIIKLNWEKEDAYKELSSLMDVNINLQNYFEYHINNYLTQVG